MMLPATGLIAQAGVRSVPAWSYADVPNQLLRVNSLEGSLQFSGGTLTGVVDKSTAGQTINITGSPAYTASNASLNGAPSFTNSLGTLVVAPTLNIAPVRFMCGVFYLNTTLAAYIIDGNDISERLYAIRNTTVLETILGSVSTPAPSIQRLRVQWPMDGTTPVLWNGSTLTSTAVNNKTGTGITIGARYSGGDGRTECAFYMLCSAVPDAPTRAALEAQLLADFG